MPKKRNKKRTQQKPRAGKQKRRASLQNKDDLQWIEKNIADMEADSSEMSITEQLSIVLDSFKEVMGLAKYGLAKKLELTGDEKEKGFIMRKALAAIACVNILNKEVTEEFRKTLHGFEPHKKAKKEDSSKKSPPPDAKLPTDDMEEQEVKAETERLQKESEELTKKFIPKE